MTGAAEGIDVSVIVCTRNRLESLGRTLASLERSRIPAGMAVELLVVDNGSADGTAAWLRGRREESLPFRVALEPRAGLARARNHALGVARGRVLVWTDDDVVADPEWLRRMAEPILGGSADAIAGRVRIPDTLRERLCGTALDRRPGLVAATEWDDWSAPPWMVGASMAFGRHVLAAVPGFDERLGAGPESLGFHEESLFAWRLRDAGFRLGGAPEAVVDHHFDPGRLDPGSIVAIAARFGRSTAYVDWHWHHLPPKRLAWLRGPWARVRHRLAARGSGASAAAERRYLDAYSVAYFDQFRRCMREPRKYPRRWP